MADGDGASTTVIKAVPVRHPGRWISVTVLVILATTLAHSFVTNERFGWGVVGEYLFSSRVLNGLEATLLLTAVAMLGGIVLGVTLAIMRLSPNPVLSSSAWLYIWFFRGTPLLVQLLVWYNISFLYPRISIGLPFGPTFGNVDANQLIGPLVAAILGLALNEAAYVAEIVRGGIVSVDRGQLESAVSLGMSPLRAMRRIILPQAMRVIVPPLGNETIAMLKNSSLVSVIAVSELLFSVQAIYAVNFRTMPLLLTASIWYLAVTSVLMVLQHYIEKRFGRGVAGPRRQGRSVRLWQTIRSRVEARHGT